MSQPEPLTPPECDLRGMPFMPLDIVRLFDSDIYALSTGDEFKAALSLWGKSFLQVPAASLPDDDRILAHLSGAGSAWKKVREMAMRGWVKCSDGRFYHPVVAEKAKEAWLARLARIARTEAARKARQSTKAGSDNQPPPSVTTEATSNETGQVTTPATISVTENVTGSKGQGQGQGQGQKERKEPATLDADASKPDARAELWGDGLAILRGLTGKPEGPSRALLGKLLKAARDDCAEVHRVLREAASLRPAEPVAWITAAVSQPDDDTRLLRAAGLLPTPGRDIDGEAHELFPRVLQ
jgi:hypothetical protein